MNEPQKELMDVPEFSRIHSLSISTVYSEIRKKKLKITKLGHRTYIKRTDAAVWLEQLGKEPN